MNEIEYDCIKRKIRSLTKIDLNCYKTSQMMRRLDGFILRSKAAGVVQYCQQLEQDPEEVRKLRNFLTINVTEFFRDYSHFEILRKIILPELLKYSPALNIWSAGCSDGEEPYSLAVMLAELTPGAKHRIMATDIDSESLHKAMSGGPYRPPEMKNVPQPLLDRYFNYTNNSYWINNRLRNKIVFSQHDMTRDRFPVNLDLIICRNVTIYFSNEAKAAINLGFWNSLKKNGVLFIGATETMLNAGDLGFERLHSCFYKKNRIAVPEKSKILVSAY
ncbi:MAG: protein-glutamate O-methyltransferase CheR [Dehalococcoidales bacterium]|nr:protein-glutamate O-methyltransferase CheR [Dehalococcoidales bacterium]